MLRADRQMVWISRRGRPGNRCQEHRQADGEKVSGLHGHKAKAKALPDRQIGRDRLYRPANELRAWFIHEDTLRLWVRVRAEAAVKARVVNPEVVAEPRLERGHEAIGRGFGCLGRAVHNVAQRVQQAFAIGFVPSELGGVRQ